MRYCKHRCNVQALMDGLVANRAPCFVTGRGRDAGKRASRPARMSAFDQRESPGSTTSKGRMEPDLFGRPLLPVGLARPGGLWTSRFPANTIESRRLKSDPPHLYVPPKAMAKCLIVDAYVAECWGRSMYLPTNRSRLDGDGMWSRRISSIPRARLERDAC